MRIGYGYDVHRFAEGNFLILGGVKIAFHQSLKAHSDGDVVLHALVDALLGAAALGDIGQHFSDQDERYRNISSLILLEQAYDKVLKKGYYVNNIDVTIITEAPKLSAYLPKMSQRIAETLKIFVGDVNVKATTNEGLGWIGQGEGLATHVVTILNKRER